MNIYQEVLNALHAEAQGILEQAGYNANSLVLKISCWPGEGWCYEATAAPHGSNYGKRLVKLGEASNAHQFLDLLRQRVAVTQLQQAA